MNSRSVRLKVTPVCGASVAAIVEAVPSGGRTLMMKSSVTVRPPASVAVTRTLIGPGPVVGVPVMKA